MSRTISLMFCLLALTGLAGCSDEAPETPGKEHVWKSQTDTIGQAQQAADELSKSMQQQSSQMESELKK